MLELIQAHQVFEKGTPIENIALNHLDLRVEEGEFLTILGSNGAGKSTLFNAICGTFLLTEGRILLDGEEITYLPEHRRARVIGRVFQDPMKGTAPNMTIEENLSLAHSRATAKPLSFAPSRRQVELFRERLAAFGMGLENRMRTKVGLLSGGQRQAVTLLMCTIVPPRLLLLDEHTAALDPATAEKVMEITEQTVREYHLTTMMITHNMGSALSVGTRTIMMDEGSILLDIAGEERAATTVEALLQCYSAKKNRALDNDRMLLQ
ncbi:MAG: ATP-binding cassette domain-containing protein [Clostridia bacterium]|nr:ATP-binding cassette domain-containing protein [Clostridia bacterium]